MDDAVINFKRRVAEHTNEKAKYEQQIERNRAQIEALKLETQAMKEQRKQLEMLVDERGDALDDIRDRLTKTNKDIGACERISDEFDRRNRQLRQLGKLADFDRGDRLQDQLDAIMAQAEAKAEALGQLKQRLKDKEERLDNARDRIEESETKGRNIKLSLTGKAHDCFITDRRVQQQQQLASTNDATLEKLRQKVEFYESRANELSERERELRERVNELEDELDNEHKKRSQIKQSLANACEQMNDA